MPFVLDPDPEDAPTAEVIDVPPPVEKTPELVDVPNEPPPPELVEAIKRYFVQERDDLLRRVLAIEEFLGFIDVSGSLTERMAKLERFVGVKG